MNNGHMTSDLIETVDALVDAFGGTTAFARWLDVTKSCVSNWRADGSIPRGHHLPIFLEAQRRGMKLAPSVFNMTEKQFEFRRPQAAE